jgi:hypothetical protein
MLFVNVFPPCAFALQGKRQFTPAPHGAIVGESREKLDI